MVFPSIYVSPLQLHVGGLHLFWYVRCLVNVVCDSPCKHCIRLSRCNRHYILSWIVGVFCGVSCQVDLVCDLLAAAIAAEATVQRKNVVE